LKLIEVFFIFKIARKEYCGQPEHFLPLPNGDCGDGIINPHTEEEVQDKYRAQRKRLCTKFDSGIQLDKESWYSVTPKAIANHIAYGMINLLTTSMKYTEQKNS